MKVLFLVADGMGDWPVAELGGKTPLEAAHTPTLDNLASTGIVGRCSTIPTGMAPGSDIANMALLGFDPAQYHTGRGPIEAAAQGLTLHENDLVWRLNLVTVSELDKDGTMLDYSSGHITTEQARPLIAKLEKELADDVYTFIPGVQYRHLLIQKDGAKTDAAQLGINPPHDITNAPIKQDLRAYSRTPELWDVLFAARDILAQDNTTKANAIWLWGQGQPLSLPSFTKQFGLQGAVVSAVDLIKGLGFASEMTVLNVAGATGLLETNYEGKVTATLEYLEKNDFAFVHLEGPDECGHGGNAEEKTEAIARFDSRIVAPLQKALAHEEVLWIICCDHYTPIATRTHTTDAVPFIINGPGIAASGLTQFTEKTADTTGIHINHGHELIPYALKKAGILP